MCHPLNIFSTISNQKAQWQRTMRKTFTKHLEGILLYIPAQKFQKLSTLTLY